MGQGISAGPQPPVDPSGYWRMLASATQTIWLPSLQATPKNVPCSWSSSLSVWLASQERRVRRS
jgi:hypothetical protein